jgi:hypothetical protein
MSPFHTPRCRIVWTEIYSGGVLRDLVVRDQSLELRFGWEVDPTLITTPGYFVLRFQLTAQPYPDGPQFDSRWWVSSGLLSTLPGSSLYSWALWNLASDLVSDPDATYFLFEPRLYINIPGVSTDQFAFSEVPHHLLIG